jgi:hypothetical protein
VMSWFTSFSERCISFFLRYLYGGWYFELSNVRINHHRYVTCTGAAVNLTVVFAYVSA